MNTGATFVELFNIIANFAVVPLVGVLFSMQGRLSRIEGQLSSIIENRSKRL